MPMFGIDTSAFFAAQWEAEMLDTVTVTEENTDATRGTFNRTTGHYDTPTPVTVYTGPAQVHRLNRDAALKAIGEERVELHNFAVRIPVAETGPTAGHLITVDACPADAALVGKVLEVVAAASSTHATRRDLFAVLKE